MADNLTLPEFRHIAVEGVMKSGKTKLAALLARAHRREGHLRPGGEPLYQGLLRREGGGGLPRPARLPGQPLPPAGPARPEGALRGADPLRLHLREGQDLRLPDALRRRARRLRQDLRRLLRARPQARPRHLPPDLAADPDPAAGERGQSRREEHLREIPPGPDRGVRLFLLQLSGGAASRHQSRRSRPGPRGRRRRHRRPDPADEEDAAVLRAAKLLRPGLEEAAGLRAVLIPSNGRPAPAPPGPPGSFSDRWRSGPPPRRR